MKNIITGILLFYSIFLFAQANPYLSNDPYHHWDGITHWSKYLIVSPGYFGPNALPVPDVKQGLIGDFFHGELSLVNHFSKRDNTNNLYTNFYIPFAHCYLLFHIMLFLKEYQN